MAGIQLPDPADFIPYTIPWWRHTLKWIATYPQVMHHRVNAIIDLFEWGCGGNVMTYIKLALPAAGELIMALLNIEYDDILRGFLKGAGLRSRSKMFGRIGKSKFSLEIPEIGEEIGKRLPAAGFIRGTKLGNGLKWIFKADAIIQRTLWYFVIIDLTTDFLATWSSGILRAQECAGGGVYVRGGLYGIPGEPGTHRVPLQGYETEVVSGLSEDGDIRLAGNTIVARRSCSLFSSMYAKGFLPHDCGISFRTYWVNAYGYAFGYSPWGRSNDRDLNDASNVVPGVPPGQYELRFQTQNSLCYTAQMGINVISAK